ncbi:hypothetical protein QF046_003174 [Microbacterium sp. W4I4]|uniref:hypothetical protein n=1 Tax=Microbacterium sp. W4I4 TaxID=3042295 RepID=UPI002789A36E|nr:hypothetical protein [Microbacterium sp. W4I4]MDQ0615533.1 hypothetical protein [Microbacterium sp. W4I4]
MTAQAYEALSRGLAEAVLSHDDLIGLVLLGSASEEARERRDEWSDHDFFAVIAEGHGTELRPDLRWLPEQHRIVLTAREGEIGFVAVYDDGHVFEFALAEAAELSDALAAEATVVVDDEALTTTGLVERARHRALAADVFDPVNDARLVLVKLLIGVGRVRRGERLNGGAFIRQWAVNHLVRAVRGRLADSSTTLRDVNDPVRRFERDHPEWGERVASALAQPEEDAALALFRLLRELEPGWEAFPTRAADVVAVRLGWR